MDVVGLFFQVKPRLNNFSAGAGDHCRSSQRRQAMKPNFSRSVLMILMILVVFVFSAMLTVTAYADDSTPPPTETPTDVTPPVEESTPEAADPAPLAQASAAVDEAAAAEILAQVPEGTDVKVINLDGEVLPLATEEAAQTLISGDPMWCPTGVAPGAASCTGSFTSFNGGGGLLAAMNNKTASGVIWIENSYASAESGVAIKLDPTTVGTTANFALTINGGWTGTGAAINGTSTFTVPLAITGWTGAVTLNNIVVAGASITNAGADNQALRIVTNGNIVLNNVSVENNTNPNVTYKMAGATLDNTGGTGTVTIKNSSFNNNEGYGLVIYSHGAITLTDITANKNGGDGVNVDNCLWNGSACDTSTPKNVTVAGVNYFVENQGNGLVVTSRGAISANYLTADNNHNGWGVILDNSHATTAQPVKLTGVNEFKFNGGGLWINSQGAITTSNVTAFASLVAPFIGNNDGVRLWNNYNFTSSVTMTGTNVFIRNYNEGLEVLSNGVITLNNIKANENGIPGSNGFGAYLNNNFSSAPMAVILNGTNTFNGNYSGGLEIHSDGAVTLSKITASDNTHGNGALIKNDYGNPLVPQSVTLTTANTFENNYGSGLVINSYGAITIANLTANNNVTNSVVPGFGAYLNNAGGALPKAVSLTGNNTFNQNGEVGHSNSGIGLQIISLGGVTLNNVKAENNIGGYGAYLNNQLPGAVGGITLNNSTGFVPSFSYNGNSGLIMLSYGAILIKNINASGNDGYGALIQNQQAISSKTVTLSGSGVFNGNTIIGLQIDSKGAITVNNITANANQGNFGAALSNTSSTLAIPQSVTMKGTNEFNGNSLSGLSVNTYGAILLNNLTADNNGADGLNIEHHSGYFLTPITITGYGRFNNNSSAVPGDDFTSGLIIYTNGVITLNNITANNNSNIGVKLTNLASTPTVPQNVTINGTNEFNGNGFLGLVVETYGAILTNNLTVNDNGMSAQPGTGHGAQLSNDDFVSTSAPSSIILNGINTFNNNQTTGLIITSLGLIKVNDLEVVSNGIGADLFNGDGSAVGGVSLTGSVYVEENTANGLQVTSNGAITIANLNTFSNGGFGAYLRNYTGSGGVTISGISQIYENTEYGLQIETKGAVTLSNLYVQGNGGNGVVIKNTYSGSATPQNVTLTGNNYFYNNGDNGLHITTYGMILLNNIDAEGNGIGPSTSTGWGAWLDNCGYIGLSCTSTGTPKGITISGLNFFQNNTMNGLWATSLGAITISNITANWNGSDAGAYLNNQWDSAVGGISLIGANTFEHNANTGLFVRSYGAVILSNLSANSNGDGGVDIDNRGDNVKPPVVTLTGVNSFSDNFSFGLLILSDGAIALSNVTAENNIGYGAYIKTDGKFKLTGISSFNYNHDHGITIYAADADLSKITADFNGLNGLYIEAGNVSIACGSFNNNGRLGIAPDQYGYYIAADDQVVLKGVNGFSNPNDNQISALPQNQHISRSCVPPPPVAVSQPKDDDDDGVGAGSEQLPDYTRR